MKRLIEEIFKFNKLIVKRTKWNKLATSEINKSSPKIKKKRFIEMGLKFSHTVKIHLVWYLLVQCVSLKSQWLTLCWSVKQF